MEYKKVVFFNFFFLLTKRNRITVSSSIVSIIFSPKNSTVYPVVDLIPRVCFHKINSLTSILCLRVFTFFPFNSIWIVLKKGKILHAITFWVLNVAYYF